MNLTTHFSISRWLAIGALCLPVIGCGSSAGASSAATGTPPAAATFAPAASSGSPANSVAPSEAIAPSDSPGVSQAPDVGGGTTAGDVPDNAVFLTYRQAVVGFSIQYVEGWQVTTRPDGVVVNDKDSSETVSVVDPTTDVTGYIRSTDLPSLQAQKGFKLVKQDIVKVGATTVNHLVFHILSPADPVTGKQVPLTVDRYYVPGPMHLAIISLSTPDGVDNVDAFRQMIESFKWG